MDTERVTLADIVDFRPRALSNEEWSRIESREGVKELHAPLERAKIPGGWAGLRNKVLGEAGGLLDIGVVDLMRGAWSKCRELEAYRDSEKYPPDKTFSVPLVEHKITSIHKPRVDIRMNQKIVGCVRFTVNIEIAIKGLTLDIRNARIKKIHIGDCKAKGSFFCEGFLLAERESARLALPGVIDLGEGIEI